MKKTPITLYADFKTASAISSKADELGISQSQWLRECAQSALSRTGQSTSEKPICDDGRPLKAEVQS